MDRVFNIADCNFTIKEAASHLKISRSKLYQLIGSKEIKVSKLGSRTLIPGIEVHRFVRALAARAA